MPTVLTRRQGCQVCGCAGYDIRGSGSQSIVRWLDRLKDMQCRQSLLSPSVVEDLKHRGTEVTEWMVAETSVFSVPLCFDHSLRWFGTAGP